MQARQGPLLAARSPAICAQHMLHYHGLWTAPLPVMLQDEVASQLSALLRPVYRQTFVCRALGTDLLCRILGIQEHNTTFAILFASHRTQRATFFQHLVHLCHVSLVLLQLRRPESNISNLLDCSVSSHQRGKHAQAWQNLAER